MSYSAFRFIGYDFSAEDKTLRLTYGYDEKLRFTETYRFDFPFVKYDSALLDRAVQNLFYLAGISYYKAYIPGQIRVEVGQIDSNLAEFLDKTYRKGLGEFWYVNDLNPRTPVDFPVNTDTLAPLQATGQGLLVGIGGGKDSLVSVEILRDSVFDIATWSLNHRSQLMPLIERLGLPHYYVEREWDAQLKTLNESGVYNGHVPISAIFATVGSIVCILTGRRDHVVSNEQSANEPTLHYEGVAINHQYSKSQEFEQDYQAVINQHFGDTIRYYSLLRPLSELRIAELFSAHFDRYYDVFSSCNTAFRHDSDHLFWDGSCAKCAFVFLALTPFVEKQRLEDLFGGKNLLLDEGLQQTYRQLLGIAGNKPLDCVGETRESRAAMRLAQQQYKNLEYLFDLDENYNYRELQSHEMPDEIWQFIQPKLLP